eukprot:GEMP01043952.1.p1 GENE.GEMP01043952.1~~GEMP01043952.1.p1  ORF type:complete len:513 (+),score=137.39 GEMP01043952.1:36-1541(+)
MSEFIVSWLNKEVRLSKKIKWIEKDFSDGYLFGELLWKAKLLKHPEEEGFILDPLTADEKRENMVRVQNIMEKLQVSFGEKTVRGLLAQDRVTALRVLQAIKLGLAGTKSRKIARDTLPKSLPRKRYDPVTTRWYDECVTQLAAPFDTEKRYTMLHKPFDDARTRQEMTAEKSDHKAMMERTANRDDHRDYLLTTMQMNREHKKEVDVMQQISWHQGLKTDADRLNQDLRVEHRALAREQTRIDRIRADYSNDFQSGVTWFENNLRQIAIDMSEHGGSNTTTAADNLDELVEAVSHRLPSNAELKSEAEMRMKKIKTSRREAVVAGKERDRRRRKADVEKIKEGEDVDQKKALAEELQLLLNEQKALQTTAEAFALVQRRKEARVQRSAILQQAAVEKYEKQLNLVHEDAVANRPQMEAERKAQRALTREVFVAKEMQHKAERAAKHKAFCSQVLDSLCELTDRVFHKREEMPLRGKLPAGIPPDLWQRSMADFVDGKVTT